MHISFWITLFHLCSIRNKWVKCIYLDENIRVGKWRPNMCYFKTKRLYMKIKYILNTHYGKNGYIIFLYSYHGKRRPGDEGEGHSGQLMARSHPDHIWCWWRLWHSVSLLDCWHSKVFVLFLQSNECASFRCPSFANDEPSTLSKFCFIITAPAANATPPMLQFLCFMQMAHNFWWIMSFWFCLRFFRHRSRRLSCVRSTNTRKIRLS